MLRPHPDRNLGTRCGVSGAVTVACDNSCDVFVDGVALGSHDSWDHPRRMPFVRPGAAAAGMEVYVRLRDNAEKGDVGGLLAEVEVRDAARSTAFVTSAHWQCVRAAAVPGLLAQLTQSREEGAGVRGGTWPAATTHAKNGGGVWGEVRGGVVEGVSPDAQWIWTADNQGDTDIWCRFSVPDAPPAAAPPPVPPPPAPAGGLWACYYLPGQWLGGSFADGTHCEPVNRGRFKMRITQVSLGWHEMKVQLFNASEPEPLGPRLGRNRALLVLPPRCLPTRPPSAPQRCAPAVRPGAPLARRRTNPERHTHKTQSRRPPLHSNSETQRTQRPVRPDSPTSASSTSVLCSVLHSGPLRRGHGHHGFDGWGVQPELRRRHDSGAGGGDNAAPRRLAAQTAFFEGFHLHPQGGRALGPPASLRFEVADHSECGETRSCIEPSRCMAARARLRGRRATETESGKSGSGGEGGGGGGGSGAKGGGEGGGEEEVGKREASQEMDEGEEGGGEQPRAGRGGDGDGSDGGMSWEAEDQLDELHAKAEDKENDSGMKIYVYPLPPAKEGDAENWHRGAPSLWFRMVVRHIMRSKWYTDDPAEARAAQRRAVLLRRAVPSCAELRQASPRLSLSRLVQLRLNPFPSPPSFRPMTRQACLLVPNVDTLCLHNSCVHGNDETSVLLSQLPHWNSGRNHLIFHMADHEPA